MAAPEPGDEFNNPSPRASAIARGLNLLLGVWLFISAFLWSHNTAQFVDTLICAVAIVGFTLVAMRQPTLRFLLSLLAIWLFLSAAALGPSSLATQWNNALVAIATFFLSLFPGAVRREYHPPHAPRTA